MQAIDLVISRPRAVPVLRHFSLGAGLQRADVSGGAAEGYGGPGADSYQFSSYFELRFHPTEWLTLQYRQGVRTFDNRQGLFVDRTRLTSEDGSTHNVGVIARWYGFSAGLYQFWNLEMGNELPNDLTRLMVAYDF